MISGHPYSEVEAMVLVAVGHQGGAPSSLASRLGQPAGQVDAAVMRLVDDGLLEATADAVQLTRQGRVVVSGIRLSGGAGVPPQVDLVEIARTVRSMWAAQAAQAAEKAASADRVRDALLASDGDRDTAVDLLAQGYAEGRLSADEFDLRAGRALAGRTYGELDDVLAGLGAIDRKRPNHPGRKVVFWVVAVPCAPFVLLGSLLLAFGSDLGDHVGGLVFLAVLLPLLYLVRRWAWPTA